MRQEANDRAGTIKVLLGTPADRDKVTDWLKSLGLLCAGGRMSGQEAEARITAYTGMLNYPYACFTDDTLRRMAEKVTWFPSFGEVSSHLKAEKEILEEEWRRLRALASPQAQAHRDDGPWTPPTQAQRDAVGDYLDNAMPGGKGWRTLGLLNKYGVK